MHFKIQLHLNSKRKLLHWFVVKKVRYVLVRRLVSHKANNRLRLTMFRQSILLCLRPSKAKAYIFNKINHWKMA